MQNNLRFLFILILTGITTCVTSFAGSVSFPLLVCPMDARTTAMGSAGVALSDDIYASFWNPGAMAFLKYTAIPGDIMPYNKPSHNSNYIDVTNSTGIYPYESDNYRFFNNLIAAYRFKAIRTTLAADLGYISYGEFTRTDINGNTLGKYTSSEMVAGLAGGFELSDNIGLGAKVKYFQSNLVPYPQNMSTESTGDGFAFDIGVLWKPEFQTDSTDFISKDFLSLGLNLVNLGTKKEFHTESEPLPTMLKFGASARFGNLNQQQLIVTTEFGKLLVNKTTIGTADNYDPLPKSLITSWSNPGLSLGLGLEYWYYHTFALRAGYYNEPLSIGYRQNLSFGTAIRLYVFQLDLAYLISNSYAKLNNQFILNIKAGGI